MHKRTIANESEQYHKKRQIFLGVSYAYELVSGLNLAGLVCDVN
jgi:hypothetical protein